MENKNEFNLSSSDAKKVLESDGFTTETIEFDSKGRAIIKDDDMTYIIELKDVTVENADVLISSNLLDEHYKEKALSENMRGKKNFTVWYEHPTKYTTTITGVNGNGVVGFKGNVTATMTASLSKKLTVTMSKSNFKTYNGYTITSSNIKNGSAVEKGGTSIASISVKLSKPGYLVLTVPGAFKAKYNGVTQGNAQVGFGISTTLSW